MKLLTVIFIGSIVGCGSPSPPDTIAIARVTRESILDRVFQENATVMFRSHNGDFQGTDNDMELVLRSDGTVLITDLGYAVTKQSGTFEILMGDTLVVRPKHGNAWLPMRLVMDDGDLLITRPSRSSILQAARNAGFDEQEVTDEVIEEAFELWPLRQTVQRGVVER